MQSDFPVLLIDDGELDDARDLLSELGVDFAHLRGGAVPNRVDPPKDLLVTTPRRALLARDWPSNARGPGRPIKIVVVGEDSQTLRGMLRRMGFDYLVRRPVHPAAFRLLLLRALYHGEDKRREPRVPIGCSVTVRGRLRRQRAVLADLSTRGCRLILKRPPRVGSSLTIQLPSKMGGGRGFSVRGRVCRDKREASDASEGGASIGVVFDKLDDATRNRLRNLLQERAEGPAVMPDADELSGVGSRQALQKGDKGATACEAESRSDRRRHQRVRFEREIIALAGDARRVLLGRDLSLGGMRIDRHDELHLGSRVQLAIYGSAREEPFLVGAVVVRDDGPEGLGLRFEEIAPAVATRLERIVAGLPAVEALSDGETGALGTVLSEIRSL